MAHSESVGILAGLAGALATMLTSSIWIPAGSCLPRICSCVDALVAVAVAVSCTQVPPVFVVVWIMQLPVHVPAPPLVNGAVPKSTCNSVGLLRSVRYQRLTV